MKVVVTQEIIDFCPRGKSLFDRNPLFHAVRSTLGTLDVVGNMEKIWVNGYCVRLEPHEVYWLKSWYNNRPVKPFTTTMPSPLGRNQTKPNSVIVINVGGNQWKEK